MTIEPSLPLRYCFHSSVAVLILLATSARSLRGPTTVVVIKADS